MSAVVDRLIVTYSLMVLWLPMTTRVGSPRYFRSWGGPPMEANWEIRHSSPMSVWDSMTTWGPMIVFFPIWHIGTDDAVRPDLDPFRERRVGGDNRRGVDIHRSFLLCFFLQGRNPPLQGGEGLPHLREFREAGLHLQPLPMGHMGRAGDDLIRRDIFVDSRPGGDHDVRPRSRMWPTSPAWPPMTTPFPSCVLPEMPTWATMIGILPDHHVVGDLDEVVDLHPPLDPGPAEGAAVDGRVRPDLHVVVDLDDSRPGGSSILSRPGSANPKPSLPTTTPACRTTRRPIRQRR